MHDNVRSYYTKKGVLPIARKKKPDWNAIKAEYIGGGISYRALADKHKVPFGTLRAHAETENWTEARENAKHQVSIEAAQKTAEAAAENAVKLQKARAMLIDRIIKALEQMPDKSGTRIRQSQFDKNTGKQLSVDYDLSTLVSAFEKLSSGSTADFERQKQFAEENNTVLMSYADLFKRPARSRTIEELESGRE